jgi:hypothetical protein
MEFGWVVRRGFACLFIKISGSHAGVSVGSAFAVCTVAGKQYPNKGSTNNESATNRSESAAIPSRFREDPAANPRRICDVPATNPGRFRRGSATDPLRIRGDTAATP